MVITIIPSETVSISSRATLRKTVQVYTVGLQSDKARLRSLTYRNSDWYRKNSLPDSVSALFAVEA